MLVYSDSAKLGDKILDLKEGIEKATEDNKRLSAQYKIPDQGLLENHRMARGSPMAWTELVRRLEKLSPRLLIQQGGIKNAIAVRLVEKDERGCDTLRYITGFYMDILPEYSSVTVDENGLPVREIRGWRSVLEALIQARAFTRKHADLMFGPAMGQRACLWNRSAQASR